MSPLHRFGLAGLLGLAVALASARAAAGDCPECQSAADCPRAGSFCVRHSGPVGCGARVQLCCPGQACAVGANGRPSCEAAGTCTVVTGPADGGASNDAGVPPTDAGVPPTDAGAAANDASVAADAADLPASSSAGCGCRVGGAAAAGRAGCGALGAALALACGRRRRRRP